MNHLIATVFCLAGLGWGFGETITIPAETYSRDSAFTKKDGKITIELPEGWSFRDQGGRRNLFAGSDLYGSITFSYEASGMSGLGLRSYKKQKVEGRDIRTAYFEKGESYGFVEVLPGGWRINASLLPYPKFKGKDGSKYQKERLEMFSRTKFVLPGHGEATDGFFVLDLKAGEKTFSVRVGKPSDDWKIDGREITGPDGIALSVSLVEAPEGQAWMGYFEEEVGSKPAKWNLSVDRAILGGTNKNGGTVVMVRLPDFKGSGFLRFDSERAITPAQKKILLPMLQAVVLEKK